MTNTASHATLKTTPLTGLHQSLGATMVDFAGYSMPLQYPGGIVGEHMQVREKAGLFDVSHMGPCLLGLPKAMRDSLEGDEAHQAICALFEPLVCGDLAGLKPGEMRYTLLLADDGGILDDLMVARPLDDDAQGWLYIVVNAATKDADFQRILDKCPDAELRRLDDQAALLALQGPAARRVLSQILPETADMTFMTVERLFLDGTPCIVTCSGYTGEDGYEILIGSEHAEPFAKRLLEHDGVAAIGLGARDSLRLEAGLCLYGHDMDETKTPVEASLTWAVSKQRREKADFPGAGKILQQIADGASMRRVGFRLLDKAPAREGAQIATRTGEVIGIITSGGHGHFAGFPVAMGYVPRTYAAVGTELDILVRNKPRAAVVTRMPFVQQNYYRGKEG